LESFLNDDWVIKMGPLVVEDDGHRNPDLLQALVDANEVSKAMTFYDPIVARQIGLCHRVLELWVPMMSVATFCGVGGPGGMLTAGRAASYKAAKSNLTLLNNFVGSLFTSFEELKSLKLEGRNCCHEQFVTHLSGAISAVRPGVGHSVESLDKFNIPDLVRISMQYSDKLLNAVHERWSTDIKFLSDQVTKLCPDYKDNASELLVTPITPLADQIANNPGFPKLPTIADALNVMTVSGEGIFSEELFNVSLTYLGEPQT
jgi:hypothetical protein